MIHSKTAALVLGLALIAGCEEKKEEAKKAVDTAQKAADATKDTAQKAADTTKEAAQKTADATKEAAKHDAGTDQAKALAAGAKDSAIAEVQKLVDLVKKEAGDVMTKAAAKPDLKPASDTIKADLAIAEKFVTEAKTSEKWSSLLSDAKAKLDSVKKQVADLTAKLAK